MRDQKHADALALDQRYNILHHAGAHDRVERGERLVHQDEPRLFREHLREGDALALPAAQVTREAIGETGKPEPVEPLVSRGEGVAALHAAEGQTECDILARCLPRQQGIILFQDDALLPWKTARENVALGLTFGGMERRDALAAADEWLDGLGLAGFADRFPRHLSGGQRKRVALAQVLAKKPRLILMDEPFASLDAIVRARVVQDVVALVERESISVLLVTHDLEEALSLSDEVYLLSRGPRAHITRHYTVPIPRPRDPIRSRMHPAFAPLYERLWADLSREVDQRTEMA